MGGAGPVARTSGNGTLGLILEVDTTMYGSGSRPVPNDRSSG
jgi:hypothetical protein